MTLELSLLYLVIRIESWEMTAVDKSLNRGDDDEADDDNAVDEDDTVVILVDSSGDDALANVSGSFARVKTRVWTNKRQLRD